jgi:hypothetical protein
MMEGQQAFYSQSSDPVAAAKFLKSWDGVTAAMTSDS